MSASICARSVASSPHARAIAASRAAGSSSSTSSRIVSIRDHSAGVKALGAAMLRLQLVFWID
jgi:hypothetical protein